MRSTVKIADDIRSGKYPKERIDITQFFSDLGNDHWIPNSKKRIQVRDVDRNLKRIEDAVNKIKASGDTSKLEPLTIVYYPEENEEKLLDGNHTVEMAIRSGLKEMDVHKVNFETQLESKEANVHRLGNLLNVQEVEKVPCSQDDIRNELMVLMDEREKNGLDPRPTKEEIEGFLKAYSHVTRATIGQWISYHKDYGGRKAPMKSYTDVELANQRQAFRDSLDYQQYAICEARTLDAWSDTGISAVFDNMMKENKRKALLIFYCSTITQANQLTNTDIRQKIEDKFKKLSNYFDVEIRCSFLRYE